MKRDPAIGFVLIARRSLRASLRRNLVGLFRMGGLLWIQIRELTIADHGAQMRLAQVRLVSPEIIRQLFCRKRLPRAELPDDGAEFIGGSALSEPFYDFPKSFGQAPKVTA